MRRTAVLLVASIAGAILAGCVTTSQFMKARSQSARTDVFGEVGETEKGHPKVFKRFGLA